MGRRQQVFHQQLPGEQLGVQGGPRHPEETPSMCRAGQHPPGTRHTSLANQVGCPPGRRCGTSRPLPGTDAHMDTSPRGRRACPAGGKGKDQEMEVPWRGLRATVHPVQRVPVEMPIMTAGSKVRGGRVAGQGACYMAVVITLSSGSRVFS